MPLQRRLSGGGTTLDLDQFQQLEGIAEDDILINCCVAPKDFNCVHGSGGEATFYASDLSQAVKLVCSNPDCKMSPFMHGACFNTWEEQFINYLKASGKIRNLSDKQKLGSLWSSRWDELTAGIWGCNCNQGYLRRDPDWEPSHSQASTDSEGEKTKQKRKRKSSKNIKPALTIGLPILAFNNNSQMKRSDAQGIPGGHYNNNHHGAIGGNGTVTTHYNGMAGGNSRMRNNSVSSNASQSSSYTSSMSSPMPSPPSSEGVVGTLVAQSMPPPRRQVVTASVGSLPGTPGAAMGATAVVDRARHDSGGSIFMRRPDFSSFNILPKHKINSYHIKMEDECSIGNDETRCFILSSYATNKMNRVPCVLCGGLMNIFERYPLIDGTLFLSPRQHTKACILVKMEGRTHFLSAVCMGCLEGWNNSLHCRFCLNVWDGSHLILGTMYSYDIFAAVPCCQNRLKCNNCKQLVIHPEQTFNFFSDYSQTVSCPNCGVQDFHFVKNLDSYVTREELSKVSANNQTMARTWAAAVGS